MRGAEPPVIGWAAAAALGTALLIGCAPSALDLVARGDLSGAYDRAYDDPRAQPAVARAIFEAERPVLDLSVVEGKALEALVGRLNARQIAPAWVVVRGRLRTRGKPFPFARFWMEVGREGGAGVPVGELPSRAIDRDLLVALTGEKVPHGSRYNTYGSDLCSKATVKDLFACLLFFPIAPLTIHKTGEAWAAPTREDYRYDAPRASRLADLLADDCHREGACDRTLLVRRPVHEDEPLTIRVRIQVADHVLTWADPWGLAARVTVTVPPGPTLATRFPVVVDPLRGRAEIAMRWSDATPSLHFCGWDPAEAVKGSGGCVIPLVPITARRAIEAPPRPAALGTPAGSWARRPWWAGEVEGPGGTKPPDPSQAPGADTDLLWCTGYVPSDGAWIRFGPPGQGFQDFRWGFHLFSMPLVHLADGKSVAVDLGETKKGERVAEASVTIARRGGGIEVGRLKSHRSAAYEHFDLACVPWDREAVEAELAKRWPAASQAVDVADEKAAGGRFEVDPIGHEDDWGLDVDSLRAARAAVAGCAALVGWDDPRVAGLVARVEAVDARWAAIRKEGFEAWAAGHVSPRWSFAPKIKIRAIATRCQGDAPCAVDAEVENLTAAPQELRLASVTVAMADGHVVEPRADRDPVPLAPHETLRLTLTPAVPAAYARGQRPFALILHPFNVEKTIAPCPPPR